MPVASAAGAMCRHSFCWSVALHLLPVSAGDATAI